MDVVQAVLVMAALKEQAVKGVVRVALTRPRAANWVKVEDRLIPDYTSKITHIEVPLHDVLIMGNVNASGKYERCVVRNNASWYDIIILKNGVPTVEGWMHQRATADMQVKALGTVAEWSKPATAALPNPTKIFFHLVTVMDTDGRVWSVVIEARGIPVTQENVKDKLSMGMFFESEEHAREYVNDRVMFFSEVSPTKPQCNALSYAQVAA